MCSHQHTPCVWDRAWFKPSTRDTGLLSAKYALRKTQVLCYLNLLRGARITPGVGSTDTFMQDGLQNGIAMCIRMHV
jgi:hypothetical protein